MASPLAVALVPLVVTVLSFLKRRAAGLLPLLGEAAVCGGVGGGVGGSKNG